MKIAVTGSSGLIGTALVADLRAHGHEVVRLVRRPVTAPDEVRWDPSVGRLDPEDLPGVEGAVNLCGVGVGDSRWTDDYKLQILSSRVDSTATLSRALAGVRPRPRVLVSQSAEGIYGTEWGDEVLDEDARPGTDFLADVVRAWEAAAAPARDAGIRVAHPRTGLVMTHRGGALARMLPLYRLGLGGRLGSGKQWWSSVSLADTVAALRHLLETDGLHGAYNLAAPEPARNRDFNTALARAVHRPAVLPVPSAALKVALGGFASGVLCSLRISSAKLAATGFTFRHRDTAAVIEAGLQD